MFPFFLFQKTKLIINQPPNKYNLPMKQKTIEQQLKQAHTYLYNYIYSKKAKELNPLSYDQVQQKSPENEY